MSIAIFPAAGGLGGATLSHLLNIYPPQKVTLVSRHPEKLEKEKKLGATVRKADFDEPASLKGVFDGCEVLNLISYPSIQNEHRFEVAKAAIDAAIASGVKHIFYSSLAFGGVDLDPEYKAQVFLAHAATEAYLAELQNKNPDTFFYTIVRIGIYSESFPIYTAFFTLSPPSKDDEIRIPHDGKGQGLAWAKRDELGEGMARLMKMYAEDAKGFEWRNKMLVLSGPVSLSLEQTVEVLSRVSKRDLKIKEVSVKEYTEQPQVQSGLSYGSGSWAKLWGSTAWEGIRRGQTAVVTPHLRNLLGREPESFEETAKKM